MISDSEDVSRSYKNSSLFASEDLNTKRIRENNEKNKSTYGMKG